MLEFNDTELDLLAQLELDEAEWMMLQEAASLVQPEYLIPEILNEMPLAQAQSDFFTVSPVEAMVIDHSFMKEVQTQALLIQAEQYLASLPAPVTRYPDRDFRRTVVRRRKGHLGGLTTLVLSISVLVVCIAVLANMLGGGAGSSTETSQQASRSSVISRSSVMGRMVLPPDTISYTRAQWATDLLKAIGNSNPSQETVYWVVNWTCWETRTGQSAAYNLLNTTQQMPGSWAFNGAGVQNFTSYSQGIHANAIVLENGLYPTLLTALQTNDLTSLTSPPDSMQSELVSWGTGWRGWGFSAAHANDAF